MRRSIGEQTIFNGILFDRKPVPELILECMYCAAQFGKPDIEDCCDD